VANSINPKMLVVARESRGYTQTGLSEELGINQSTYSRQESGVNAVSEGDLVSICKVLQYPKDFFCQDDRVYGFASPVFFHRKRTKLSMGSLRVIQSRLNIFRFHSTRLLSGVEIDQPRTLPAMQVDEYGSPEKVAELVRVHWKMPMGPLDNIVDLLESAGVLIMPVDFETPSIDAVVQIADGCSPVMLINSRAPGDRLRFTLAHELGHLVMHNHPSPEMEEEADAFASELLLPQRELRHALTDLTIEKLPDLKMQWRVSMAALIYRAKTLGVLSERQYRSFFVRLGKNGWRTTEPCPIQPETPTLLDDVIKTYRQDLGYTIAELARLVNATEACFREDYINEQYEGLRLASFG